ncbi:hypothetical protein KR100_08335 [Synechococcus sp. KORDI-100]|nr:hypothetical protein KR100_08335 [Synechococcus sp. KORDI-100]
MFSSDKAPGFNRDPMLTETDVPEMISPLEGVAMIVEVPASNEHLV